ncbi:MAG TPA: trypsin-like peptidase domain-containing protein [Pseudonocardiaceae bacterium]|nr:trypsin-like peptidase domain-containing protein [Pseudonocardiaceae bacterium]
MNEVNRLGYPAARSGLGSGAPTVVEHSTSVAERGSGGELPPWFSAAGVGPTPSPPAPARHPLRLMIIMLLAVVAVVALRVDRMTGRSSAVPSSASPGASSAMSPRWVPSAPWAPQTSTSASNESLDLPALAAAVDPAVVDINTQLGISNGQGAGTGIVLSSSGEVITNNHVISGATTITATDVGNGKTYPATVLGYDPSHDIAVLQLRGASGLATASIGDSNGVAVGDHIAAIGNAGGRGGTPSVAAGTVSALNQAATVSNDVTGGAEQLAGMIQVAADVQPGDSGGPLVNTAGQVIGIDTAGSVDARWQSGGNIGLAVPINDALTISRQIWAGTASTTVHIGATGVLGVLVDNSGAQTAPGHRGRIGHRYGSAAAVVAGVVPGSPAAEAGLTAGDTIVSLDGTTVDSPATLTSILTDHHPGDSMRAAWMDVSGQQHTATVRLASGPPN